VVSGEEISVHAKNAIVAIEDDQFYQHHGIDVMATIRGVLYTVLGKIGLRSGGVQGGSTITQQVVKIPYLLQSVRSLEKLKSGSWPHDLNKSLLRTKF